MDFLQTAIDIAWRYWPHVAILAGLFALYRVLLPFNPRTWAKVALGIVLSLIVQHKVLCVMGFTEYLDPELVKQTQSRYWACKGGPLGFGRNETACSVLNTLAKDGKGAEVAGLRQPPKLLTYLAESWPGQNPRLSRQAQTQTPPRFLLASTSKSGGADCVVVVVKVPSRFLPYICDAGRYYGIDANVLASQLYGENPRWNPKARSYKGAKGLAQIMPAVAKAAGVDPTNPEQSIHYMARRVSRVIAYWQAKGYSRLHATMLAWAEYNGGPKAQNWLIAHNFRVKRDRWAPIALWRNQTAGYILDNLARCGQYLTEQA